MKSGRRGDCRQRCCGGSVSRRDVMRGALALGLTVGGMQPVPIRAQAEGQAPAPAYIPQPDSEILRPIEPLSAEKITFSLLNTQEPEVTDFVDNRFTEWLEAQTNVHI